MSISNDLGNTFIGAHSLERLHVCTLAHSRRSPLTPASIAFAGFVTCTQP